MLLSGYYYCSVFCADVRANLCWLGWLARVLYSVHRCSVCIWKQNTLFIYLPLFDPSSLSSCKIYVWTHEIVTIIVTSYKVVARKTNTYGPNYIFWNRLITLLLIHIIISLLVSLDLKWSTLITIVIDQTSTFEKQVVYDQTHKTLFYSYKMRPCSDLAISIANSNKLSKQSRIVTSLIGYWSIFLVRGEHCVWEQWRFQEIPNGGGGGL